MTDRTNPSVNRSLADEALDHVDHALGRPVFPLEESYRNYFAADAGGALAAAFDASPWWELSDADRRLTYFHVTDEGRKALARHLAQSGNWKPFEVTFEQTPRIVAARTRAKAKYTYWLAVTDMLPDLSFADFARRATVRRLP